MDADEARRLRREQRARRSRPAPRPGGGSAVYRRRRITAILALLGLAAVLAFAIRADRTDYPDFTSSRAAELRAGRRPGPLHRVRQRRHPDPLSALGEGARERRRVHLRLQPVLLRDRSLGRRGGPRPLPPGDAAGTAASRDLPLFNTPEELATSIEASGWDACDTASNHSLDQGEDGIASDGRRLRARRGPPHRVVHQRPPARPADDPRGRRDQARLRRLHRLHQRDPAARALGGERRRRRRRAGDRRREAGP